MATGIRPTMSLILSLLLLVISFHTDSNPVVKEIIKKVSISAENRFQNKD